jgi:response regulator RpfG family c-di-GMP phosphodiesterase
MTQRVLLVDDDENLLRGLQRGQRKQFQIDVAVGGKDGLAALAAATYAVVVSDMRMPGMDGIDFLGQVRQRSPDTVRMMLTGNADLDTAMRAVNEGNVFRFITKPCDQQQFASLVAAGIRQHRLVVAEKELLEQTLNGAIRVCTEILSAVDATTYGQALKVRDLMRPIAACLGLPEPWQVEVAALLAHIGNAAIPPVVMVRHRRGNTLTSVERDMIAKVPEIGYGLLRNVPRLQPVAELVRYADKHFDGSGWPHDDVAGVRIPDGARALKLVNDFVALTAAGESPLHSIETLRKRTGVYDPAMLAKIVGVLCPAPEAGAASGAVVMVPLADLAVGDLLVSNVETVGGVLLIQAGPMLTQTMLERLRNFAKLNEVKEPIAVERPRTPTARAEPAAVGPEAIRR